MPAAAGPRKPPKHVLCGTPLDGDDLVMFPVSVAVLICTYKRPAGLRSLLASLNKLAIDQGLADVTVYVIDNDASGSAREVVEASAMAWPTQYVVEPSAGIPAARTAALANGLAHDFVAFVDDDEVVSPGWLADLLRSAATYGSDAVAGPVRYEYPPNTPAWIERGGFFDSPDLRPGTEMPFAATNNLLMSCSRLREVGLYQFDQRFAFTGGSDTAFTKEFTESGGRLTWSDRGEVRELVPPERATPRWVLKRAYRTGNGLARIQLMRRKNKVSVMDQFVLIVRGGARIASGMIYVVAGLVQRNPTSVGQGIRRAARGAGVIGAAFGHAYAEYKR